MSLRICSLNGGRFVGDSPDEEPQTVRWLKGLSAPGAVVPDVLCLQDFRVSLLKYMRPLPHFYFAPMTHHNVWSGRELVGICIASKYPIDNVVIRHTWGDGIVREQEGVGDDNRRIEPGDVADALILKTENRVVVACTVYEPGNPRGWRVATHHGFWVRGGVQTPQQMQSTDVLCNFLAEQGRSHGGIVYAADCNFDREGGVLRKYVESGGRDCLPVHIKTTVAAQHPGAKFGVKPDRVFMWPDNAGVFTYDISDVHMDSSPGSDHDMLCCTVRQA